MIEICLSCDWDFKANPDDRGEDDAGAYFCKWCSGDGKVALSQEKSVDKLKQHLADQEATGDKPAQPEAEKQLRELNVQWAE
jgi:hypothetical protein